MQNNQPFNDQTDQRVDDAIAAKVGRADNVSSRALPANLRTAQGGETISPAGATAASLSVELQGVHGALYAQLPLERSIQGNQSVESVATAQKDARIGGTGPIVSANAVGLQKEDKDVPASENYTATYPNNASQANDYIPNVGNRFSR